MSQAESAVVRDLTMSVTIDAPPERVWRSLTDYIGEWWPAEFFAGGEVGKRSFRLEAQPGGRMLEEWTTGGGVLWATVISAQPNVQLQVIGYSFPNWGGPSQWYGTWDLEALPQGTKLTFGESAVGRVSEAGIEEKDKGWRFLWQALKAHVEGLPAPVWQD